jgi:putative acetyltransferase
MTDPIEIRESVPDDRPSIETIYPQAFPDENLRSLVNGLLSAQADVLSLVAILDAQVVAHVLFTMCGIEGLHTRVALLGPLAVAPARQRKGIGTALIRGGLRRLETAGIGHVHVLGEPAYYGRFGFRPEERTLPPYPLPTEWRNAWQSLRLGNAAPEPAGQLIPPEPWLRPELWAP